MKPQSLLFLAENVPRYVHRATKKQVLSSYREAHRNLSKHPDPFVKKQLKLLLQHGFARFKHITNTAKINGLLEFAKNNELQCAFMATQRKPKDVQRLLELALTTYGVKETPLRRVLATVPQTCDHKPLYYSLNNVSKPTLTSFHEHEKMMEEVTNTSLEAITKPYWKLVKIMISNKILFGQRRRRLHFWPEDIVRSALNVFGQPITMNRQKTTLATLYEKFQRDAIRPIHPLCLDHIAKQSKSPTLSRMYRRRFQALAKNMYTIDEDGKLHYVNSLD